MPRALDIANWIVQYRSEEMAAPVDAMSLEKLIYYAQAFHLVLFGEPLFPEEVRAWKHGPVVKAVYERYSGPQPIEQAVEPAPEIPEQTENFLRDVASVFGGLTAFNLSDATHEEKPWQQARHGYNRSQNSDVIIPPQALKEYYSSLIEEGEEALSRQELLSVLDEPRWGAMYVAGICVNQIRRHPLYKPILAKKLNEAVDGIDSLPSDLYAPITRGEYLEMGDTRGLSGEEIARRALALIRQ